MSFVSFNGQILASTLSTLNFPDYNQIETKIKSEKDKRKTKYTVNIEAMDIDVPMVVGIRSRKTLQTRVELTHWSDQALIRPTFIVPLVQLDEMDVDG